MIVLAEVEVRAGLDRLDEGVLGSASQPAQGHVGPKRPRLGGVAERLERSPHRLGEPDQRVRGVRGSGVGPIGLPRRPAQTTRARDGSGKAPRPR